MSYKIPQEMLDYLHTMITPEDGETLMAFDLDTVDWSQYEDNQLHGLICRGDPDPHLDEIWRVLRPGAHIMMFAPEDQPTGHSGACAMEDKGFEIRDAILWVREAGHIHYVPKASSSERNEGCAHLAQSRQVFTYEFNPKWNFTAADEIIDSDAADMDIEGIKEELLAAGVDEDTVDNMEKNGIPENVLPDALKPYFVKAKEQSKKYGNFHPTVKPKEVMRRLLESTGLPQGATVLDPFMGSGSMGLACLETGHKYIGIEKEEDYIRIADARIKHHRNNLLACAGVEIESEAPQEEKKKVEMSLDDLFGM